MRRRSTTGRWRGLSGWTRCAQLDLASLAPIDRCQTRRWRRCWHRRPSRASTGSTVSTTTWCARTRSCSPGLGCGVVRIKGTAGALAMSVDGNGRFGYLNPREGAQLAVAEAARNVACAGALADRRDEQSQLRQPREARDHVAVRRGRRRHRRGVPRARHPDHRRQRQSLQRDRRQGDPPDARARCRRRDRGRLEGGDAHVQAGRHRRCIAGDVARRARRFGVSRRRCTG